MLRVVCFLVYSHIYILHVLLESSANVGQSPRLQAAALILYTTFTPPLVWLPHVGLPGRDDFHFCRRVEEYM
jgi:hypothetical protein